MNVICTIDSATQALVITADAEAREQIAEELQSRDELAVLTDMTEGYWTNGSFRPFDGGAGRPFVGLTSAPCVAEDMTHTADGEPEVVGRVWWFPDYAVKSFAAELRDTGRTVFPLGIPEA